MPINVLAGTPYKRNPDPQVVGTPNSYGLYPWSTFRARCMLISPQGAVAPAQSGSMAEALLFTSDIPAIVTATISGGSGSVENGVSTNILASSSGGAPGVTVSAFGEVARGYAGASYSVQCSGFPVLRKNTTILLNDTNIDCIANGSVICSPVGRNSYGTGSSIDATDKLGTTPIILRASDYTQAMYDNGNIIVENPQYGYGGSWIIVGLYRPT